MQEEWQVLHRSTIARLNDRNLIYMTATRAYSLRMTFLHLAPPLGDISSNQCLVEQAAALLMGKLQERVEQTQLIYDVERGEMERIPAKVEEKISVLFQDDHRHTGTGQQNTQHHVGRPSSYNTVLNRLAHRGHNLGYEMLR